MGDYELGFEDALKTVLLKIDEVKTLEELRREIEKLIKSVFRIRMGPTFRRLEP